MMKGRAAAVLAMAALAGSASGQECVPLWGRCDGPEVSQQAPCCGTSLHCVQKDVFYAQCRPVSEPVPADRLGDIVPFSPAAAAPVTTPSTGSSVIESTSRVEVVVGDSNGESGPSEVETYSDDNYYGVDVYGDEDAEEEHAGEEKKEHVDDNVVETRVHVVVEPVFTPLPNTPTAGVSDGAAHCAGTYDRCGPGCSGEGCAGLCCNPADHCMKKDKHYAQCRPKDGNLPAGWIGTIVPPSTTAAPAVETTPAPAAVPVATPTPHPTPVAAVPGPTTAEPVTGHEVGQCVATYEQCGGVCDSGHCGDSCCNASDLCIQKHEFYAQCLPMDHAIPSGWEGTIIA